MTKLETIKALSAKLLSLKKLKKDLKDVDERLSKLDIGGLSGTHIKEALDLKVKNTEEALIALLSTYLTSGSIKRVASHDITCGFVAIEDDGKISRALVIETGEIKDLAELDEITEV